MLILGHTHRPMSFPLSGGPGDNPGSVVSVPGMDSSRTFAMVDLDDPVESDAFTMSRAGKSDQRSGRGRVPDAGTSVRWSVSKRYRGIHPRPGLVLTEIHLFPKLADFFQIASKSGSSLA